MDHDLIYEGQQVRVIDWGNELENRPGHWNPDGDMDEYKGCIVTVGEIDHDEGYIYLIEGDDEIGWQWYAPDFEEFNPLPKDNPNRAYRIYRQEKRIAALRKSIKSRRG